MEVVWANEEREGCLLLFGFGTGLSVQAGLHRSTVIVCTAASAAVAD